MQPRPPTPPGGPGPARGFVCLKFNTPPDLPGRTRPALPAPSPADPMAPGQFTVRRGEYHSVWGPEEIPFLQHGPVRGSETWPISAGPPLKSSARGRDDEAKGKAHVSRVWRREQVISPCLASRYVELSEHFIPHSVLHARRRPQPWLHPQGYSGGETEDSSQYPAQLLSICRGGSPRCHPVRLADGSHDCLGQLILVAAETFAFACPDRVSLGACLQNRHSPKSFCELLHTPPPAGRETSSAARGGRRMKDFQRGHYLKDV